ncbi:hypothetical protein V1514DRAFT_304411 [Lipomyces japonicus]|uniref:uncharacterized protein n=1 Tax=Lipomyces japonicus TaxID=56871 RepID=UPI0034CF3EC7
MVLLLARRRILHGVRVRKAVVKYSTLKYPELDSKWAAKWSRMDVLPGIPAKGKFYVLAMFPYPSGNLHMGHVRVYTISDAVARFRRLYGYNVLHPMGWDAFGLPAENAANERGISPKTWTYSNIEKMKQQLQKMLVSLDWDKEFATCSPEYYKHTQKLFLDLFKSGYAYKKEAPVNWDPVDQTVLANEQVDSSGRSWRSGALVEQKMLSQWFFKITGLVDELDRDLELLDKWPNFVKQQQKNWIGKSSGAEITFELEYLDDKITVYTTRPDTLLGVQYLAVADTHPLALKYAARADSTFKTYMENLETNRQVSMDGFKLQINAINPLNNERIPVYVAPYVLGQYGHGAVMGVPGHDERDFKFLKTNLESFQPKYVVVPPNGELPDGSAPYTSKIGILAENSEKYKGLSVDEATDMIVTDLEKLGKGKASATYRLRDWLVSRQRYWGAPIPIIHCGTCGPVGVPESDLPVNLPTSVPLAGSGSPLARDEEWVNTTCPKCGGVAKRDTDTMDTFVDSSWYYLRYPDAHNASSPFSYDVASSMVPVDLYIGGVEHAILHLLYARFFAKFFAKQGSWSGGDLNGEPFRQLITQGMVQGKTYTDPQTGRFLKPDEVDFSDSNNPIIINTGGVPNVSYEKMSKSKYNGVDPDDCIAKYGADATRAHVLFQAPISDELEWDEAKIVGIQRWLARVWRHVENVSQHVKASNNNLTLPTELTGEDLKLWMRVNNYIRRITTALEKTFTLNTLISDYIKLTNAITGAFGNVSLPVAHNATKVLIKVISPVVPATAEESWAALLEAENTPWTSVLEIGSWPEAIEIQSANSQVLHNVMINGKRRFGIDLNESDSDDDKVEKILSSSMGQQWLVENAAGKSITKVIVAKGRQTISFVLK